MKYPQPKLILSICIMCFCLQSGSLVAQVTFQKTFGGPPGDYGYAITATTDGGCIIAGRTASFGAGVRDGYLVKLNSNGDSLWVKTYGGWQNEHFNSIQQTTDHGFIMAGYTESFGSGGDDFYVVRVDSMGNLLWSKTIGGSGSEIAQSVQQTTDGGFIVAGWTTTFVQSSFDGNIYVVKLDNIGNVLWSKSYGGNGDDQAYAIEKTSNGGFLLTGTTSSAIPGNKEVFLIEIDSLGNLIWQIAYGTSEVDVGFSIEQTNDFGYVISGASGNGTSNETNILIMKTDSTGNIEWTQSLKSRIRNEGWSVKQTTDGGYVCTGYLIDQPQSISELYIVKLTSQGDTLWTRHYNRSFQNEKGYAIDLTDDGGYIIAGDSQNDLYVIKTDSLGLSGCNLSYFPTIIDTVNFITTVFNPVVGSGGIVTTPATVVSSGGVITPLCSNVSVDEIENSPDFQLYPNPVVDEIVHLDFQTATVSAFTLDIYDTLNRSVYSTIIKRGTKSTELSIPNLAPGIYTIQLSGENKIYSRKLLKQ